MFLLPAVPEILTGRPALSELRVVSPRLTLLGAGGGRKAGLPELPIRLAVISNARVEAGAEIFSGINCRLSSAAGKVDILSCGGKYEGFSALFSGAYSAGRASARGRLDYPRLKAAVDFEYALQGVKHVFSAKGAAAGAPLEFKGELAGTDWKGALYLEGPAPLRALFPKLPPLKYVSSAFSASGSGFSPGTAVADGKFRIIEKPGSAAEGTFSFRRGDAALKAAYLSGGVSAAGEATLRAGALSGNLRADGGGELRLPGGSVISFSRAKAACTLGGRLERPAAACEAEAGETKSADFAAEGAKFSGALELGDRESFRFRLSLLSPALAKVRLDSAELAADGTREENSFSIRAVSPAGAAALEGAASFKDGLWKAELGSLSFSRAPGWQLCSPAGVGLSVSGGVEISGLCLSSGESRLLFSGMFRTAFPEEFHVSISSFPLQELQKAGLTRLKAGGVVNASADYPGNKAGEGIFFLSAEGLELEGFGFGAAGARGTFTAETARLEEARWKIYDGEAGASGRASFSGGRTEAEFLVKASSMNIAPLLAFLPQVSAREIWVNGESRLLFSGKVLEHSGTMDLAAPRVKLPTLGLELENASVRLAAGDLSSARVSASAGFKGGYIRVEGALSASGPAVRIRASAMPFSHPAGLYGKTAADLLLAGSWGEPELSGAVELRGARFEMEKWDKFKSPQEKSRFYEALALEVKLSAERDVWYREGADSVEVKGSLLLKKDRYRQPATLGTIDALKGYYTYLGNTFTITSGRLTFTGETPVNPGIDVSAAIDDRGSPIKVYFNASGKARNPQITLASDPPLEQRDIISFLVTGKPLYELYAPRGGTQQGRTADNTAQNLVAGYISKKAASTFGKKLNIDMISVKVDPENRADLTVGRYVRRDLFISYGQVLGQGGERRVSAEYSISRHWSLEGKNSSSGRYVADLLFKFGIK